MSLDDTPNIRSARSSAPERPQRSRLERFDSTTPSTAVGYHVASHVADSSLRAAVTSPEAPFEVGSQVAIRGLRLSGDAASDRRALRALAHPEPPTCVLCVVSDPLPCLSAVQIVSQLPGVRELLIGGDRELGQRWLATPPEQADSLEEWLDSERPVRVTRATRLSAAIYALIAVSQAVGGEEFAASPARRNAALLIPPDLDHQELLKAVVQAESLWID